MNTENWRLVRSSILLSIVLSLVGCSSGSFFRSAVKPLTKPPIEHPNKPGLPTEEEWLADQGVEVSPPTETKKTAPNKIQKIDWDAALVPLVENILRSDGVKDGALLLVGRIENNTNGRLNTDDATATLRYLLASNGKKFTLVLPSQLASAREALGLSEQDSLGSRSKAISVARHLDAEYVLYADLNGEAKTPKIDMQLMLVKTGEILWSGEKIMEWYELSSEPGVDPAEDQGKKLLGVDDKKAM